MCILFPWFILSVCVFSLFALLKCFKSPEISGTESKTTSEVKNLVCVCLSVIFLCWSQVDTRASPVLTLTSLYMFLVVPILF